VRKTPRWGRFWGAKWVEGAGGNSAVTRSVFQLKDAGVLFRGAVHMVSELNCGSYHWLYSTSAGAGLIARQGSIEASMNRGSCHGPLKRVSGPLQVDRSSFLDPAVRQWGTERGKDLVWLGEAFDLPEKKRPTLIVRQGDQPVYSSHEDRKRG